jgi:hypothetical protein
MDEPGVKTQRNVEKHLNEIDRKVEQLRKTAEKALDDLHEAEALPGKKPTPNELKPQPHLPGLG